MQDSPTKAVAPREPKALIAASLILILGIGAGSDSNGEDLSGQKVSIEQVRPR